MSEESVVTAATVAAVAAATDHGVVAREPAVLSNGFNLLVHLAPAPVVARIVTVTGEVRNDATGHIRTELAIAQHLEQCGIAGTTPSAELPVRAHQRGGFSMSFWRLEPIEPDRQATPEEFGHALRELHEGLRSFPRPLVRLGTPVGDIQAFVSKAAKFSALTGDDVARMSDELDRLADELGTGEGDGQAVHGDAHPGNLVFARDRWLWTDFEDACGGPLEWDLACLAMTDRLDGRAAVKAYGYESVERLRPYQALRRLHFVVWMAAAIDFLPGRNQHAQAFVDDWRASPGTRTRS